MLSRYRSYTTYSEENGRLVPSVEPIEVKTTDNTLHLSTQPTVNDNAEKKLKSTSNNKDN
jgi:hypothetical protein